MSQNGLPSPERLRHALRSLDSGLGLTDGDTINFIIEAFNQTFCSQSYPSQPNSNIPMLQTQLEELRAELTKTREANEARGRELQQQQITKLEATILQMQQKQPQQTQPPSSAPLFDEILKSNESRMESERKSSEEREKLIAGIIEALSEKRERRITPASAPAPSPEPEPLRETKTQPLPEWREYIDHPFIRLGAKSRDDRVLDDLVAQGYSKRFVHDTAVRLGVVKLPQETTKPTNDEDTDVDDET